MGLVTLRHRFDNLAAPRMEAHTPTARDVERIRRRSTPATEVSAAAFLRRAFSAVTRLAPVEAPSRDRRSFVPSAVLLKGRGRDVESLAASERTRAALRRTHVAVVQGHVAHGVAAESQAGSPRRTH